MAKIQAMVMRPTIFEVEAGNFEKAKEIIIDGLIKSRQMRPTDPIEIREIVAVSVKEIAKKERNKVENK